MRPFPGPVVNCPLSGNVVFVQPNSWMIGWMDDCESENQLEAEEILKKIVADFEQLDRTIDLAITLAKDRKGQTAMDIAALQRAREAVRKGAALAKSKVDLP